MPSYCLVQGCENTTYRYRVTNSKNKSPQLSFFKPPKNKASQRKWVKALLTLNNQETVLKPNRKICETHFLPECLIKTGSSKTRLKPNSVPSEFPQSLANTYILQRAENSIVQSHSASDPLKFTTVLLKMETTDQNTNELDDSIKHGGAISQKNETPTPIKSKFVVRYPGDVTEQKIQEMTPDVLRKTLTILKSSCEWKTNLIKRLRLQQIRQKKNIECLKELLLNLKENSLILPDAYNALHKCLQKL